MLLAAYLFAMTLGHVAGVLVTMRTARLPAVINAVLACVSAWLLFTEVQ